MTVVSPFLRYKKKQQLVHGLSMAYIEAGTGDPIVFFHGNPASSYHWRNVIPHVDPFGRCIAFDLIGMGDSDKFQDSGPGRYTFAEHRLYVDGLLEALGVRENVALVLHDWGSVIGFDWANRHRDAVRAIAYMEALVKPPRWDGQDPDVAKLFRTLRSPAGDKLVLEENYFVETMLPSLIMRKLTDEEMGAYRRPFLEPGESWRPTLTFPRQIPFDGEPPDVHLAVESYSQWLSTTDVSKLFIDAKPGLIMAQNGAREFARSLSNQHTILVEGIHFVQEDCPSTIGRTIAEWRNAHVN